MVEHHLVVLAPDARLLVPAEGGVGRIQVVAVGPDPPCLEAAAHAMSGIAVAGPQTGAEAVERVIGEGERVGFVLKVVTATTGPKISSWKTRILLWPRSTVGCM